MRLKSYFAPSVQAAIGMARREFGDEITLVTSHVAPADARQLGEYEVVFDVEESEAPAAQEVAVATSAPLGTPTAAAATTPVAIAEPAAAAPAPFSAFQETLLQAVAPKPAVEEEKAQKLRQIRFTLIELGIEAGLTRAIMGMLEGSIGKRSPRTPTAVAPGVPTAAVLEPVAAEPVATQAVVTPAEPVIAAAAEPLTTLAVTPSLVALEVAPAEPVAPQPNGKVVVISKRRDMHPVFAVGERTAGPLSANAQPVAPISVGGPTAAELAFISSLSGDSSEYPLERRAVGC